MPSTLTHAILPASCAVFRRSSIASFDRRESAKFAVIAAIIGNLPDLDVIPATLMAGQWKHIHRYWGHNSFSLVVWMALGAFLLRRFVSPRKIDWRTAGLLAAALVLSHVALDAMGSFSLKDGRRHGVPLLYPFSKWEFLLPLEVFSSYELKSGTNPLLGHILSSDFWTGGILSEILGSFGFFAIWAVLTTAYQSLTQRPAHVEVARVEDAMPQKNENPAA